MWAGLGLGQPALEGPEAPEPPPPADAQADEVPDPGFVRFSNPAFPSPVAQSVPIDRGPLLERDDLAPYFASGPLLDAKTLFDANKIDAARAILAGQGDAPPVRYLRGVAALKAKDYAAAAKELEPLAEAYPALRDRILVLAGTAYEGLKDFEGAARVYGQVSNSSRTSADGKLGAARALVRLRKFDEAKAAVDALAQRPPPPWGRDVGAEGLLALADVAQARRDVKLERELLTRLWAEHPVAPQADRAEARLSDFSQVPIAARVARAEGLIDAHRNAEGVRILEAWMGGLKLPDPTACRAAFALAKGHRKLRAHGKVVTTLAPVIAKCTEPELRAKALFTQGYSLAIVGGKAGITPWLQLATEQPGHPLADDALFSAAEQLAKAGDREAALQRFSELVARDPAGEHAGEATFRMALMRRVQGQHAQALELLEGLEKKGAGAEDSFERERSLYWQGRAQQALGKSDAALERWARLSELHPTTYYGLLARRRIAELDAPRAAALEKRARASGREELFPRYAGPVAKEPGFLAAVELLRLGFGNQVPQELLGLDRTQLSRESLQLMVLVLSYSGETRPAHGLARLWLKRDLTAPITADNRAFWEIAYPRAFRDMVETSAKQADTLDPDLLQALIREESALDPKALSWAGALGLAQLMPATAGQVASQLKLRRPSTADLLQPQLNLRLGARYLADVLKRAKGQPEYALAGYNAGESAVKRWKNETPGLELDEWVEHIPLHETRNYVKRVLRSYTTYRLLYAPAEAPAAPGATR